MKKALFATIVCLLLQAWSASSFVVPTTLRRAAAKSILLDSPLMDQDNDDDDDVYHKGGNAGYADTLVKPSRPSGGGSDGDVDCEETFIDLATGDELCWGVAPDHPRNVVASTAAPSKQYFKKKTSSTTLAAHDDDDTIYHKGGNAHFQAMEDPRKLQDDDCEHTYIDFATGDELCLNDYDKSMQQEMFT